jgi:hypothetical protein
LLLVELQNRLSTDVSQKGDRFEARVLEPQEYRGRGRRGAVWPTCSVRARRRGAHYSSSTSTRYECPANGDWREFSGQVVEVVSTGGDDGRQRG